MRLKVRTADDGDKRRGPSREEIENLCMLHAVGPRGCRMGDLPARLGLSATLVSAVAECVEILIRLGWLEQHDDDHLLLTDAGHAWLGERLADLKVA